MQYSLQQHFGIGFRGECDAARLQFCTQILKVVNFAVIDQSVVSLIIPKRLIAALREIKQRQSGMDEPYARLTENTCTIGTSVTQNATGFLESPVIRNSLTVSINDAENSTHVQVIRWMVMFKKGGLRAPERRSPCKAMVQHSHIHFDRYPRFAAFSCMRQVSHVYPFR